MKARIPLPNDLKSAVKTEIEAERYIRRCCYNGAYGCGERRE